MIADVDAYLDPIWDALEADLTAALDRVFAGMESERDEEVRALKAQVRELKYMVRCLADD